MEKTTVAEGTMDAPQVNEGARKRRFYVTRLEEMEKKASAQKAALARLIIYGFDNHSLMTARDHLEMGLYSSTEISQKEVLDIMTPFLKDYGWPEIKYVIVQNQSLLPTSSNYLVSIIVHF